MTDIEKLVNLGYGEEAVDEEGNTVLVVDENCARDLLNELEEAFV